MKSVIFLLAVVITSCALPEQNGNDLMAKKYFNLDSLMESQIEQLESLNPMVNKRITIDGKQEKEEFEKIDWNKELMVFINSDINKPKLLDQYKIEETTNGNETLHAYEFLKKGATGVQKMSITKDKNTKYIQKVEVESLERNALFSSYKNISMVIKNNRLTSYSMIGFDKVAMRDTMWYDVEGVLVY